MPYELLCEIIMFRIWEQKKISINIMKSDKSAQVFNEYHKSLFLEAKEEMLALEEEAKAGFYREGIEEFNFYSRNIKTYAAFCLGNFYMVIDVKNNHQPDGCSVVTANFNKASGKKYELADIFNIDNYNDRLFNEISEIENAEPNEGRIKFWKDYLYQYNGNDRSFVISRQGLLLCSDGEEDRFL